MEQNTIQRTKPDWKQLLPVYGIYKFARDVSKGEPSLIDSSLPLYMGFCAYHGIVSIFPITEGLRKLLE